MHGLPDTAEIPADCVDCAETLDGDVAESPFTALKFHYGMLLGVADFETEQSYHRGKMRLHNAWLHREGVVWGLDVSVDVPSGEIRVEPGLALDASGRELHLDERACLSVGAWYADHRNDPDLEATDDGSGGFDVPAHVVARFRSCLTRPVPAIGDPCSDAGTDTAYSRVFETIELLLLPGLAPPRKVPYHLLRLLFDLEEPVGLPDGSNDPQEQQVLADRADILALPSEQQPAAYLEAFRRYAAFDTEALEPAMSADGSERLLFPARDDEPVVLANVTLKVVPDGDGWKLSAFSGLDTTVRPSHVATATIQELLCGPLFSAVAGGPGPGSDAGGPRVDPATVEQGAKTISFKTTKPLLGWSVEPEAFSVTAYGENDDRWKPVKLAYVDYYPDTQGVTLTLKSDLAGALVRLIARGTGPTPLLGADLVPFAGATGGPPGTKDDGHDFVLMIEGS